MVEANRSMHVYPRGFLGRPIEQSPESPTLTAKSPNLLFGFNIEGGDDPRQGSEEIDALYHDYIANHKYAKSFDCFKACVIAMLRHCSTTKFGEWLFVQRQSPKYSPLHERFLVDTCNYIATGKRTLSIWNWQGMFKHHYEAGLDSYGGRVTETNTPLKLNESNSTEATMAFKRFEGANVGDVLLQWAARPGGYDDLITSLFLVFGSSTDNR